MAAGWRGRRMGGVLGWSHVTIGHGSESGTNPTRSSHSTPVFHPEFGRFMLEATPGRPWGIGFRELLDVEPDMRLR